MRVKSAMVLAFLLVVGCESEGSTPPDTNASPADDGAAETTVTDVGGGDTAGGDVVDCEILKDPVTGQTVSCMGATPQDPEVACPDGYQCSGLSAFWCYRGTQCELPVCLPPETRIATPAGEVPVSQLRVGQRVWTQTAAGERVAAPIAKVGSVAAPAHHQMMHLSLADGRALRASPGHPLADGEALSGVSARYVYDGAAVVAATLQPYGEPRTWDLLPAGETGRYWANGVLLGSTLGR